MRGLRSSCAWNVRRHVIFALPPKQNENEHNEHHRLRDTSLILGFLPRVCGADTESGSMKPLPKGKTAKQLRAQRRRATEQQDREFQHIAPAGTLVDCVVGHSCLAEYTCEHHLHGYRRWKRETRWDRRYSIRLCFDHHEEIERIGDRAFYLKYKNRMNALHPEAFIKLRDSLQ